MQCLHPIRIRHPTLKGEWLDVPCGKCVACLSRRRQSWVFRLKQELNVSMSAKFITLTYDNENVPWMDLNLSNGNDISFMCLHKPDLQRFFKRLRKFVAKNFDEPVSLRYFAVGEYGSTTQRPHYHIILFNFPSELNILEALAFTWKLGLSHVGEVTDKSISYVAKYVLCKNEATFSLYCPPFMVCSKGIGESYLTPEKIKYHKDGLKGYVTLPSGARCVLPRYYRTKIFTEEEQVQITAELHRYLFQKELDYIRKYGDSDVQAAESGTAMMKSQLTENYVKNVKRGMTKGRKL